jgi:hypothetical protein
MGRQERHIFSAFALFQATHNILENKFCLQDNRVFLRPNLRSNGSQQAFMQRIRTPIET